MEKGVVTSAPKETLPEETEPPPHAGGGILQSLELTGLEAPMGPRPISDNPALEGPHLRLVFKAPGPAASQAWRRRYFPQTTRAQWNDWRWQVRNRVTSAGGLARFLTLSDQELAALAEAGGKLPLSITPYYLSLVDAENPADPLRRCVVPTALESLRSPGECEDPLNEDGDTVLPGLVHRYPDRVLLLATGFCSTYCRYCTRSRLVGDGPGEHRHTRANLDRALAYIAATPEVRDVLISGGDPLTMGDDRLEYILSGLRRIKHVELVRIGTKAPVVLPQRVTPGLVRMLRRYHPLFMSIHFTHPAELTPEVAAACTRLADAGIPLGSQTVLLRGINDQVEVIKELVHGLLKIRVRPYYLYQCDPISGSAHFRTPVAKGLEIIQGLRGHTSGYGVPTYVIDAPGGGGKVALYPEAVVGRRGDELVLRNYEGGVYTYPDPGCQLGPAVE